MRMGRARMDMQRGPPPTAWHVATITIDARNVSLMSNWGKDATARWESQTLTHNGGHQMYWPMPVQKCMGQWLVTSIWRSQVTMGNGHWPSTMEIGSLREKYLLWAGYVHCSSFPALLWSRPPSHKYALWRSQVTYENGHWPSIIEIG